MQTQTARNSRTRKTKNRVTKMAASWTAGRQSSASQYVPITNRRADASPAEQLLRHVLDAMMRCETPTIANIAAEAEICEECCHEIMLLAKGLGFIEWHPGRD